MSEAFARSRINNTDPGPWHQLLILSQAMINKAFWNMWAISDPESPIRKFSLRIQGIGSMDGLLKAPMTIVNVVSASPRLFYVLKWASGTLILNTSENPAGDSTKQWDITDWVLVFPVTIGRKILDRNDPNAKPYLDQMGNPSGIFSLAQLFIDSSQAASYDPKLSKLGADWSKEPSAVQTNFASLIDNWLKLMIESKKTLLGVSLQTDSPTTVNPGAPTFPPTSVDYDHYPWLDPAVSWPQPTNLLDENALCYLMMTASEKPPLPPVLKFSGTWVNGSDAYGAAIVIRKDQFWDQWFCKLLKFLNFVSQIRCDTPVAQADNLGGITIGPRFTLSANRDHPNPDDFFYEFKPQTRGFEWLNDISSSYNSDGGAWNKVEVWEISRSRVTIDFVAGGQAISIRGYTFFQFVVKQTGIVSGPFKTGAAFTITLDWHINLAIGVVSDGGLQIVRIPDQPGVDAVTVRGVSSNEGIDWRTPWDQYQNSIRDRINVYFGNRLKDAENNLMDGLAKQNKLFLPSSGTFLMEGAQLNARGDLLANLHYNGATPPSKHTELPGYLNELPLRKEKHVVSKLEPLEGIEIAFPAGTVYPTDPKNREFARRGPFPADLEG